MKLYEHHTKCNIKKYYPAYWNAPTTFRSIFVAIHSKSFSDVNLIVLLWSLNSFIIRLKKVSNRKQIREIQNVKLNIHYFIGNFDFSPLISPGDSVRINDLRLILNIIGQCGIKHVINNNVRFECIDKHH